MNLGSAMWFALANGMLATRNTNTAFKGLHCWTCPPLPSVVNIRIYSGYPAGGQKIHWPAPSHPVFPVKAILDQPTANPQPKSAGLPTRLTADHRHVREPCWDQPEQNHIGWTPQTPKQNNYLRLPIVHNVLDKMMWGNIFPLNVYHWWDPIYLLEYYFLNLVEFIIY